VSYTAVNLRLGCCCCAQEEEEGDEGEAETSRQDESKDGDTG